MLQVIDIHKSFGKLKVLKGIDFTIEENEIASIVGPSGAGKTTLLQMMGTLDKPSKGEVYLDDVKLSSLHGRNLARFRNQNIGFIFQFHNLLTEFTALENVCIPALISGKSKKETQKRAEELLENLNLIDRKDHKPAELSGGEMQRVAVARALINNPKIILADEPSGNLDTENKKELYTFFTQLRKLYKQTFVIVTHDMSLAKVSDRIIKLQDGKIVT